MSLYPRASLALMCLAVLGARAGAQPARVVVIAGGGGLIRYRGDTIWNERDTTLTRTVYEGDTVVQSRFVNDRRLSYIVFAIVHDSARVVRTVDSIDAIHLPRAPLTLPASVVLGPRTILALMIQTASLTSQAFSMSPGGDPTEPPWSPKERQTYRVSASVTIQQLGDTVQYFHGCPGNATDTTTFVFTGDTTVRRKTLPARSFGWAMTSTIIGEMQGVLMQQLLATTAPPPELVGRAPSCLPSRL